MLLLCDVVVERRAVVMAAVVVVAAEAVVVVAYIRLVIGELLPIMDDDAVSSARKVAFAEDDVVSATACASSLSCASTLL